MIDHFDCWIAGVGTAAGLRAVVGHWPLSPFGTFTDVMVERAAVARDGTDQGRLAPMASPVRFGFGSTRRRSFLTRIVTLVRAA